MLPDDYEKVSDAFHAYATCDERPPQVMTDELASFVRIAASASFGSSEKQQPIPELSAVRTNVRDARNGTITPRFWYMLPNFTSRHQPAAFVPRINNGLPWVESNLDPAILIDANFSTFWAPDEDWSRHTLKALLNSTWCRALMEALGTPLGGGALKLEATHLRYLPVPRLSAKAKDKLEKLGRNLTRESEDVHDRIDQIVMDAVLASQGTDINLSRLLKSMTERAQSMSIDRQRAA